MSKWFEERYILRSEHEEIVGYYRRLLAQLHITVRDLRDQLDVQMSSNSLDGRDNAGMSTQPRSGTIDWSFYGANVVSLDLRRKKGCGR